MSPKSSESDKNNMTSNPPQSSPAGSEPLQNMVIVPGANPAAPPQPQLQQPNLPQNLTALERISLNNIVNEFRQSYGNNFAPILNENAHYLEATAYWICREIEDVRHRNHFYEQIMNNDNMIRHIVEVAYHKSRNAFNWNAFQALPPMDLNFTLNLTYFILRFLIRHQH
jgi:hypothetical protein